MSTARQQIIEKTSELLERQGYYATGLNQIVAESETPRGSLYYYFPAGKEELAAEAISHKAHQMSDHAAPSLARFPDAVEAIYRFVLDLADNAESQHCATGAPMAAVALETAANNDRLREACQAAYQMMQEPFEQKLLADGIDAERARALAIFITAALEGSVVLSRTERSSQPVRILAEELKRCLRVHPQRPSSRGRI